MHESAAPAVSSTQTNPVGNGPRIKRMKSTPFELRRKASTLYSMASDVSAFPSVVSDDDAPTTLRIEAYLRHHNHLPPLHNDLSKVEPTARAADDTKSILSTSSRDSTTLIDGADGTRYAKRSPKSPGRIMGTIKEGEYAAVPPVPSSPTRKKTAPLSRAASLNRAAHVTSRIESVHNIVVDDDEPPFVPLAEAMRKKTAPPTRSNSLNIATCTASPRGESVFDVVLDDDERPLLPPTEETRNRAAPLSRSGSLDGAARVMTSRRESGFSIVKDDDERSFVPPAEVTRKKSAPLSRSASFNGSTRITASRNESVFNIVINEDDPPVVPPAEAISRCVEETDDPGGLSLAIGKALSRLVSSYKAFAQILTLPDSNIENTTQLASVHSKDLDKFIKALSDLPTHLRFSPTGERLLSVTQDLANAMRAWISLKDDDKKKKERVTGSLSMTMLCITSLVKSLDDEHIRGTNKPLPLLPKEYQTCDDRDDSTEDLPTDTTAKYPLPKSNNVSSKHKSGKSSQAETLPSTEEAGVGELGPGWMARARMKVTALQGFNRKRGGSGGSASLLPLSSPPSSDDSASTTSTVGNRDSVISSDSAYSTDSYDGRPLTNLPFVSPTETTLVDVAVMSAGQRGSLLIQKSYDEVIDLKLGLFNGHKQMSNGTDITYSERFPGKTIAMSPERIVQRLCSNESLVDTAFTTMVFRCFRMWCTPLQLLDQFVDVYKQAHNNFPDGIPAELDSTGNHDVKINVIARLKAWTVYYWRIGDDDEAIAPLKKFLGSEALGEGFPSDYIFPIFKSLERLAEEMATYTGPNRSRRRTAMVAELERDRQRSLKHLILAALTIPLHRDDMEPIKPKDFNCDASRVEMAHQLTLRESELYRAIEPEDVMRLYLSPKGDNGLVSEKLRDHKQYLGRLTHWTQSHILQEGNATERAHAVKLFVEVAKNCIDLNNFNTALHIWCGINACNVGDFVMTRQALEPATHKSMMVLNEHFDSGRYSACNKLARAAKGACVPIISCFRGRLHRLVDTYPQQVPSKVGESRMLINTHLFSELSVVITEMEQTHTLYALPTHDRIQRYLDISFTGLLPQDKMKQKINAIIAEELREYGDLPPKEKASFNKKLISAINAFHPQNNFKPEPPTASSPSSAVKP